MVLFTPLRPPGSPYRGRIILRTVPAPRAGTKTAADLLDTDGPLPFSRDLVFSGTTATGGTARTAVTATGMRTELGRIAALSQRVQRDESPLERQVKAGRVADRGGRDRPRGGVPAGGAGGRIVGRLGVGERVLDDLRLLVGRAQRREQCRCGVPTGRQVVLGRGWWPR